jgi:hypothetical protein
VDTVSGRKDLTGTFAGGGVVQVTASGALQLGAGPLSAAGRQHPRGAQLGRDPSTANGALVGVGSHLALPPSAASPAARVGLERDGGAPLVAGYRLRLAAITAARDADVPTATATICEGQRQGLDAAWLLAVAARHWPQPRLPVRAFRAGRDWTAARLRRLHRPRRQTVVVAEQDGQP